MFPPPIYSHDIRIIISPGALFRQKVPAASGQKLAQARKGRQQSTGKSRRRKQHHDDDDGGDRAILPRV